MSTPIDRILPLLRKVKKTRNGWDACCPAHDDEEPSLGVAVAADGKVLLSCRSQGCTCEQIVAVLGLTAADLFPGPSLNGFATGKAKPESDPKAKGKQFGRIVATYDYTDFDGRLQFQVVRFDPKDFRQRKPNDKGGWDWKIGLVKRVPYRLPELLAAPADKWVFVPEGEKDVDALVKLGLAATTNAQGAGKWASLHTPTVQKAFAGRRVAILPDNDDPGRAHAEDVARRLAGIAAEVRIVQLPGLKAKGDVSDWLLAGGTSEKLLELVEAAAPVADDGRHGDAYEGDDDPGETAGAAKDEEDDWLRPEPIEDLFATAPPLAPVVVEGMLRRGETLNLIAPSKVGKSWLATNLAFSVAMGRKWLVTHATTAGRVLLVDNELHEGTLAYRLRKVAAAMGISADDLRGRVEVISLRGRLRDIYQLRRALKARYKSGEFALVILDALYRFYPAGVNENGNAEMAGIYNELDGLATDLDCALALVHHSTKGDQSEKRVTDVGSGAGSVSRAADTHLVLREHQEENVYVLEAAVRSFPPLVPRCLRWEFPLWSVAEGLSPDRLKRPGEEKIKARHAGNEAQVLGALDRIDPEREGVSITRLRTHLAWNHDKTNDTVKRLEDGGLVVRVAVPKTGARGGVVKDRDGESVMVDGVRRGRAKG